MIARTEGEAILALASTIKNRSIFARLLLETAEEYLSKKYPALHRAIRAHVAKYYWVTRDYEDPTITYVDVVRRVQEAAKKQPAQQLARLRKEERDTVAARATIAQKCGLSRHDQRLFQAFRDGVYLKELRKKFVSQSLTHWDPVLNEISRRTFLTMRQVRFLRTQDILPALQGKESGKVVNARIEKSLWWCHPLVDVRVGKDAHAFFKKYIEVDLNQKSFSGTIASSGTARGPVKIVMNPEDVSKIVKGDIMVTVQAVPSMAVAFKNAAAVIADGGTGVTSHTATLAREVGIPAITGARIATRLLHDGDLVTVDAIKGIVTLIP